ncbi:MFS transporter [Novosphingobium rosa]|uniref:MFS transporter n=1 Tax=Novosphingobium rosa TaxID=76978 RepID=UPI00082AF884|nr:MFS transporter [Novosphingobium rosa]
MTALVASRRDSLPLPGLLALAASGFLTILTEALPAGLLPQIAQGLTISQAMAGQMITIYALGSLLAAIPLTKATQHWPRRPLLLLAIAGFAGVNLVTALSSSYAVIMGARFLAGVSAGLLWALLAGYAGRMVPAHLQGRAIAIAMVGTPLALSIGLPAGTWLGALVGWRVSFGIMSGLTVLLVGWAWLTLPDFAGVRKSQSVSLVHVLTIPRVATTLLVTLGFVLAHNILYTYIAPFLAQVGMAAETGRVLLVFGVAALASIWVVGVLVDRHLHRLTMAAIVLFAVAALPLAFGGTSLVIYGGVVLWGLAFGGAATLFQTALAESAGHHADIAQSMIVTVWNLAIAGGGLAGGLILEGLGVKALAWSVMPLLLLSFYAARLSGRVKPDLDGISRM